MTSDPSHPLQVPATIEFLYPTGRRAQGISHPRRSRENLVLTAHVGPSLENAKGTAPGSHRERSLLDPSDQLSPTIVPSPLTRPRRSGFASHTRPGGLPMKITLRCQRRPTLGQFSPRRPG